MEGTKKTERIKHMKGMEPLFQKHQFWDSQPVPHLAQPKQAEIIGSIEVKELKDVRPTPLQLPEGFEWCTVDLMNTKEIDEVFL